MVVVVVWGDGERVLNISLSFIMIHSFDFFDFFFFKSSSEEKYIYYLLTVYILNFL